MKKGLLILIIAAGSALGQAQERSGFSFTSPLRMSAGREEQLLVGADKINDTTILISPPTMTLADIGTRGDFTLHYTPEFQLFAEHTNLNSWNHAAGLRASYKLSPRLTLGADDSFLRTEDATRSLGESAFLLPRQRYQENMLGASLGYSVTPNVAVSFGYNNTITDTVLPQRPQAGSLLEMAHVGTAGISYAVRQYHRLSASYSLLKIKDYGSASQTLPATTAVSRPSHSFGGGYAYDKPRGFLFDVTGGITRGGINSYSISGDIGRRWTSALLQAGYSRQISAFRGLLSAGLTPVELLTAAPDSRLGTGLLLNNVFQVVTLRYREMFGSRFGVDLKGLAGRTNSLSLSRNINSLTGRLRFYYRISDRVSAFAGAEFYNENFNELLGTSLARRRYLSGIMISLSHEVRPIETSGQHSADMPDTPRDISADWPQDWGTE